MGDFVERPLGQPGSGRKIKANLALAMFHDPDVLRLDEPAIGLDILSNGAEAGYSNAEPREEYHHCSDKP
jgi:ABC-2 type transport system ATP-binding protein